jgi:hypothetical protein
MLIGVFLLLCFASVPVAGGRLGALADVRLRARPLLMTGLALQILIVTVAPGGCPALHAAAHVASYALAAGFVFANRAIPFLWTIALGGLLNFVAIVTNGGVMPAAPAALATAGIASDPGRFSNSAALAAPHLRALGDVFAVPASWPVSNVFSIGDVLIVAGAFLALHALCGSRLFPRRRALAARARPLPASTP